MQPDSHLVCFSLRGLPERMRAARADAHASTLSGARLRVRCAAASCSSMRRGISCARRPSATREAPGARFLFRLAKKARKRWTGLTTITQDPGDLLDSPLGQAVVNNASQHFLLRQSPQAIDRVGRGLRADSRRALLPFELPYRATDCYSPASSESRWE